MSDLAREKRLSKLVGAGALAAVMMTFAAVIVRLGGVEPDPDGGQAGAAQQLRDFDDSHVSALISVGLRLVGLLLIVAVARFLYDVLVRRDDNVPSYILYLGVVAPILVGLMALLGYFAFSAVVDDFIDLPVMEQTNDRADDMSDDDGLLRAQTVGQILGQIVFAAWLITVSAAAMGVGLLPKFVGYFGYGAAAALVLAPFAGEALFIGWLGSVALLMLDMWPGGRPPSWDSGKAEPATF